MIYTVAVDSTGTFTDFTDTLIVLAETDWVAREIAERFIIDKYPQREVLSSEAYRLNIQGMNSQVLGTFINTDEE